jgi:NAD(P)-dependent dehydrogenase (short-subunit alcohol dehydrogenase family)
MTNTMQGKTVIVTGATAGIGFETARVLAGKGAQVVIISRSPERCRMAADQIKSDTGNNKVHFIAADLSYTAGIQDAAYQFKRHFTRLDVLVNNAGAFFDRRMVNTDGHEMTFALNHLNYFLLTHLLLDVLKTSSPARVVNVSSDAHRGVTLNFDDLQNEKNYQGFKAYGQSKLCNVLFTYELAHRLDGTRVTANALHPGFVSTKFATNNGPLYALGMRLMSFLAKSPQKGAQTSIYLASAPEVEGVNGKYFTDSREVDSSPASYDRASAERLWQTSLLLIGQSM